MSCSCQEAHCGGHLSIVCENGCADAEVSLHKTNAIAALPVPTTKEKRPTTPGFCWCGEPVAPRLKFGIGRPPTKCEKHVVRKQQPEAPLNG